MEQLVGRDRRAGVKRHIQSRNMRGHDEYDGIGSREETQTLGEKSDVCDPLSRFKRIHGYGCFAPQAVNRLPRSEIETVPNVD